MTAAMGNGIVFIRKFAYRSGGDSAVSTMATAGREKRYSPRKAHGAVARGGTFHLTAISPGH